MQTCKGKRKNHSKNFVKFNKYEMGNHIYSSTLLKKAHIFSSLINKIFLLDFSHFGVIIERYLGWSEGSRVVRGK